jgi:aspartyl protease family protein
MRGGFGMQVIGWLMAVGLVTWLFHDYLDRDANPNRVPSVTASGEVVLKRNRAGHFTANGTINGEPVQFIVDTGATQIAIPARLAERLKLKRGMPVDLLTAAGPARGYSTRLQSVTLATIEAKDLAAVVAEGMQPEIVLLGMNFLRRLELIQRGDELILSAAAIRQPPRPENERRETDGFPP